MKNVLVDALPLGSRWELFIELDKIDDYIDTVIDDHLFSAKNDKFGALTSALDKNVYSCLIFKKAKLTSAFPFYYSTKGLLKAKIKKIHTTRLGDAYLTCEINGHEICAVSVDYSFNKRAYSKKMNLYFSAIAYNFSKIDLQTKLAKPFVKVNSGFLDEYTITCSISENMGYDFIVIPEKMPGFTLPLLAKEIYMQKPRVGNNASGDIWLTCFSEDFSVRLEKALIER